MKWTVLCALLFALPAVDCAGAGNNSRLTDPDPNAWKELPMEVVISDLQQSDGIFTSFICEELIKRLRSDPLNSLAALNKTDKPSRIHAFNLCLSPEADDFSELLKSVATYSDRYPEIVKEIRDASK